MPTTRYSTPSATLESLDSSASEFSEDLLSDLPHRWSDLFSYRFWVSACSAFLFTSLPRGSYSRLWRALLLVAGVWYAGASCIAEQLITTAKTTLGAQYDTVRKELLIAQHIFPLEDRMTKAAAYASMSAANLIPDKDVVDDIEQALAYDPYAPDLLQGLMWFQLRVGKRPEAEKTAQILWATEGCIDCWLKVQ